MENIIIAATCGALGAMGLMAYRAFRDKRNIIKLPMMFQKTPLVIYLDCKGKTIGEIATLVHEHSQWFGENAINAKVELDAPCILKYNLESDSELALFKLRWSGHAAYIYDK